MASLFPAELQPLIVVVWAELPALLAEHLDVDLQDSEREGVERESSLRVLCLAVRLDDLAVDNHASDLDREGSRIEVESIQPRPGQLATAHA